MQKLSKLILFLFLLVSLNTAYLVTTTPIACAQEAFPAIGFPCDKVEDPEFHSLRPYQGAACGDAGKAFYCSNTLKFVESFNLSHLCPRGATEDFTCDVDFDVPEHDLFVELDNSMFPIMGNTEEVTNSQGGTEEYGDAQKVNEYASWYLSGVNNRAEYGENTDDRVVNYSGPVQKLLPKLIQEAERIQTINKATVIDDESTYTDDESGSAVTELQNHNQVVVCADENILGIWGKTTPQECYSGNRYRLGDWNGDLSLLRNVLNILPTSDAWNKRTPPLPWDDGTAAPGEEPVPFESQLHYQKAYGEWQGKSCIILPIVGVACIDNPLIKNKWADLYQYIPLSNTTDKKGAEQVFDVRIFGSQGTVIPQESEKYDEANQKDAPLYFAHTQEVRELSELLNKTYTPADSDGGETGERTPGSNIRGDVENNVCSAVNIRTNKGDNLFPGDRPSGEEIVIPGLTYKITQVRCKVRIIEVWDGTYNPDGSKHQVEEPRTSCDAEATVELVTTVKTPSADEIFNTTVAGSGSTFRRIFPKVGEGAPITCIADIPTVSDVTYTGESTLNDGQTTFKVENNPVDSGSENPQLTFPHVGSVYEYFLNGIQTALRPKGYGEQIYDGVLCSDIDGGDCSFDMAKVNKGIAEASAEYNVPEELLRGVFEWEAGPYIADPSSYQCTTENSAGAIGVAQMKKGTYDFLTCGDEKMENDIGICSDSRGGAMSRCNIPDAIELMARLLLFHAGKLNNCQATGSMSMANKDEWWAAVCGYHGGFTSAGGDATVLMNYQNSIPVSERPIGRNMNYCDAICHRMGYCPSYPTIPGGVAGSGPANRP